MKIRTLIVLGFSVFCLFGSECGQHESTALARPAWQPAAALPQPRRVVISGYAGYAMEPFVSRDGRYLLFNNLNQPGTNTDIHFAQKKDDFTWVYQGKVKGINTPALEGCPTMDRTGRLFFLSTRSYPQTLCTIYSGLFKNGTVTDPQVVEAISIKRPGMVNLDVDVSADGNMLIFVDSRFKSGSFPQSAKLVMAKRDGTRFTRSADSTRILHQVNTTGLEYAPTISSNKLTLYFTRFDPASGFKAPQIYRATRASADAPFGRPVHLAGLGDYVEGTALSANERLLYFHRKDGLKFNLYAITLH